MLPQAAADLLVGFHATGLHVVDSRLDRVAVFLVLKRLHRATMQFGVGEEVDLLRLLVLHLDAVWLLVKRATLLVG
jgi:hypothetical protein